MNLGPRKGVTAPEITETVEAVPTHATLEEKVAMMGLTWRDPATHAWKLETGPHTFHVGGSSNTALAATIDL